MSTRKAASAYHHWARNHSSGKGKRRFRQPGYRPDNEGRTPRGCGAAFMTHSRFLFSVVAATPAFVPVFCYGRGWPGVCSVCLGMR
ncbi:hypothetical protein B0G73_1026 [Paraburkholderia sp. BL25I1N1]|nr:hypothetical protein B0G73_1026 [Paraburkholderia sp. BL25I1N1]